MGDLPNVLESTKMHDLEWFSFRCAQQFTTVTLGTGCPMGSVGTEIAPPLPPIDQKLCSKRPRYRALSKQNAQVPFPDLGSFYGPGVFS